MGQPSDYSSWTNEQLIERVTKLEQQLKQQASSFIKTAPETGQSRSKQPRVKKDFDPSRYNTRFIALKFAYLGRRYNGYEHHANNTTRLPTIEEELWKALMKTKLIFPTGEGEVNWEGCEYSKCGRTDKGVSAFGQVIGLRVRSNKPKEKAESHTSGDEVEEADAAEERPFDSVKNELSYPRVLNRVLPDDIRVLAWCPSPPPGFSARFSCRERRYRYFFTQPAYTPRSGRSGLLQRRNETVGRDGWLDIAAMQEAASHFVGVHDFRNFCKLDPARQITNYERTISRAVIEEASSSSGMVSFVRRPEYGMATPEEAKVYTFTLHGSAFLWHQVRHMVAILFLVGQGLEEPSIVRELLDVERNPTKPMYEMGDDAPLVLWDCIFPAEDIGQQDGPKKDALEWAYADAQMEDSDLNKQRTSASGYGRYGPGGLQEVVWAGWRRRKIDEVLAGSLLDVVAGQPQEDHFRTSMLDETSVPFGSQSTKVFDGGNEPRLKGLYTPLMQRERMEKVEVMNARYAERKSLSAKTPTTSTSTSPDNAE